MPNALPAKVGARSFSQIELMNSLEFEPHYLRFIEALENRVLDYVYRLLASCTFLILVIKFQHKHLVEASWQWGYQLVINGT